MTEVRKLRQDVFIRVCKDSGYRMDHIQAASIAAGVAQCHPLDIWKPLGVDNMEKIATGNHPICKK